jgi:transposase
MARPLVSDELWSLVSPLLPPVPQKGKGTLGGRPRLDDRKCLTGILFILKTGIPWEDLPQEMGCGSGMTCWRRLEEWMEAGVWQRLHLLLLNHLQAAHKIDWSRACLDSCSVASPHAKKGKTTPRKITRKRQVLTQQTEGNWVVSATSSRTGKASSFL